MGTLIVLFGHLWTFMDINGRAMNTCRDFGHFKRTVYFGEIFTDSWTFEYIKYFLWTFVDIADIYGHS